MPPVVREPSLPRPKPNPSSGLAWGAEVPPRQAVRLRFRARRVPGPRPGPHILPETQDSLSLAGKAGQCSRNGGSAVNGRKPWQGLFFSPGSRAFGPGRGAGLAQVLLQEGKKSKESLRQRLAYWQEESLSAGQEIRRMLESVGQSGLGRMGLVKKAEVDRLVARIEALEKQARQRAREGPRD